MEKNNLPTMIDLFTGIGGFSLAAQDLFKVVVHVEKDPECQKVLLTRWPDIPLIGDVIDAGSHNIPNSDIVTFGSPCQDLSIAGKREGLHGARSGLFFEAIRIVRETGVRFALWENVPGALSNHSGKDFRIVLSEMLGSDVPMPRSKRWAPAGMVRVGNREVAWRVLDSQFFGVPQRRRRIFVIADFRGTSATEILFESTRSTRNNSKGKGKRQGTTRTFTIRSGKDGGGKGYLELQDGAMTLGGQPQFIAYNIATNDGGESRRKDRPNGGFYVNETDKSNTVGSPEMTAIVMAHGQANAEVVEDGSPALTNNHEAPILFDGRNMATNENVSPTLLAKKSGQSLNYTPMVFTQNQREEVRDLGDKTGSLSAEPGVHQQNYVWEMSYADEAVRTRMQAGGNQVPMVGVRRLTPTECARLQGFPDDWNDFMSNTARYKQFGNAVTVNVVRWILTRMAEVIKNDRH